MNDTALTIGGTRVASSERFDVVSPATGEVIGSAPAATLADVELAFTTAAQAQRGWAATPEARGAVLHAIADATEKAAGELAGLLSAETGKPTSDAHYEVGVAVDWFRYYADLALEPVVIPATADAPAASVERLPLGVVVAITPWNFPITLGAWKVAPALRAGNTVVLKPSPFTPLATLRWGEIIAQVSPPGLVSVLTGGDELGTWLTRHPTPRKITLTGSTPTGRKVAEAAAGDLKRVTLELGANDPAIVLPGTDIAAVAEALFWSAFGNNGQVCAAVKRIYVHESQHADLVQALCELANAQKVGTPEEKAQLGPLTTRPQFELVSSLVADALARGATAAAGGAPIDRPGYFFAPTILVDVTDEMRIVREEQFGPALPILAYSTIDEAVERANSCDQGLIASVWGPDSAEAVIVARRINSGSVTVNQHSFGARPDIPFGGYMNSGIGVENGPWGLEEFTAIKVIAVPA